MSLHLAIDTLAARITNNAKVISTFCEQSAHLTPAVGEPSSAGILPFDAPESVQRARHTLLETSYELQKLSSEPSEYLEQQQIHYQHLTCLQWLLHFQILGHVPLTGSISYTAVAVLANVPIARLKSVARMAITGGVLSEPQPDFLMHSRISAQLVSKPGLFDWAVFMTRFSAPTAARFTEATQRWGETAEKHQTAYNLAFNTELPFFAHVAQSKDLTTTFASYLRSLGQSEGSALQHVLNGFDWAALGKAHVVDVGDKQYPFTMSNTDIEVDAQVGGSTGQVSILLAAHYPQLEFTVQDLPSTIVDSDSVLAGLEPSVISRITFVAHDFMTPQPAAVTASTNVYFLRKIIHDWPFGEAKIILQHLAEAMNPNTLLIIMDTILPKPGSIPAIDEAGLRVRDLTMAQSFNSKERELGDWMELLRSTVPRLHLRDLKQPSGSAMAVMVVVKDSMS